MPIHIRHVLRRLAASPSFTIVTLLTIAIGIGANTAIFSVVNGVLLKPLPYPHADRLVGVWETAPGINIKEMNASPSTYFTYRENNRSFEDIGLWSSGSVSVTHIAEPEQVDALFVTDGLLPVLGVGPVRGRWFSRNDDLPRSPETVMLSYGYWQRRFGGAASVIGRRIMVDGKAREIIGVMPRDFRFLNEHPALFLPMQFDRAKSFIGNFSYQAIARLKPGVTLTQANADVARMLPILMRSFAPAPGISLKMIEDARLGPDVHPLKDDVIGDIGKVLWVLMATVGMVLLIACANVANLLLVRADGRQRELAIRAALGAGWTQIARELLVESVLLGCIGGALGLGLAYAAVRALAVIGPADLPRVADIGIDPAVLAFTAVISLAAGMVFGVIPVLKYAGPQLANALRQGGRTASEGRDRHRSRNALVVVQVALALVLLIGSGLMLRTLWALKQVQPGFTSPEHILTLRVSIPGAQFPDPMRVAHMQHEILDKLAAVPGVTAVSAVNSVTMDGNGDNDPIFAEDRPAANGQLPPLRRFKFIAPGYFRTMGNPLIAGRDLTWTDIEQKRPVVLLSENLAREYWHSPAAALGRRVRESGTGTWREIVGVAGDERDNGVNQKAPTIVYWPLLIENFWGEKVNARNNLAYAVRSPRAGAASFLKEVQQAVWSADPELPVANVRTVQKIYASSMARTSFTLVMLALAAGMALLLGIIGIYGVLSYSVSQRTREIGIRMALGAQHETVRRMFLGEALRLAGIGLLCGVIAAVALTRLMAALLFGVSPLDPVTYGAVALMLGISALLASYIPARRATAVEPMDALRME